MTLIAPPDGNGVPLPCIAIVQSDAKDTFIASSRILIGINYFKTDPEGRYPGMPKVMREGVYHQGMV